MKNIHNKEKKIIKNYKKFYKICFKYYIPIMIALYGMVFITKYDLSFISLIMGGILSLTICLYFDKSENATIDYKFTLIQSIIIFPIFYFGERILFEIWFDLNLINQLYFTHYLISKMTFYHIGGVFLTLIIILISLILYIIYAKFLKILINKKNCKIIK